MIKTICICVQYLQINPTEKDRESVPDTVGTVCVFMIFVECSMSYIIF